MTGSDPSSLHSSGHVAGVGLRVNQYERQAVLYTDVKRAHSTLWRRDLNTVAADKGYCSSINKEAIVQQGIPAEGLQKPGKASLKEIDLDLQEHLHNRRAGIEPLIGHVKRGGQMERSRMRSDQSTLGAGYGSVLGFNLRQMLRHQQGKIRRVG